MMRYSVCIPSHPSTFVFGPSCVAIPAPSLVPTPLAMHVRCLQPHPGASSLRMTPLVHPKYCCLLDLLHVVSSDVISPFPMQVPNL